MTTTDRWQQITALFEAALNCAPTERTAFLAQACNGDAELQNEVLELLDYHEKTGEFMVKPVFELAAKILTPADNSSPSAVVKLDKKEQSFRGTERFEIKQRLGQGGFGVVYQVYDRERREDVALKTLHVTYAESLYRFKKEFRALADVHHANLVELYELMSDGEDWFFTMELIEGSDLLSYLQAGHHQSRDDFDHHARLRSALRQLVEGVCALHAAGKLHRDIKPSNVLATKSGRIVLLDFGLITESATREIERSLDLVGTPIYMSPEQSAGRAVTAASDWYSVGVILYQALTGSAPFDGQIMEILTKKQHHDAPPPSALAANVPPDLDSLCVELLRRDPTARPQGREILSRLGGASASSASGQAAELRAAAIPLIGREQHMQLLANAFEEIKKGRAVAVFAHGSSGMGKSALVRKFLEQLEQQEADAVIFAGRCYEREALPYKALDSLIDALSKYLKRLPTARAESLLPRDILALARLFPVLRQVTAIAKSRQRDLATLDSRELRRRAFAALRELLMRLADNEPLLLFIDDLQWGDIDSAALLGELLCHPEPPPLLFIFSYRDEEAESSPLLHMLLPMIKKRSTFELIDLEIGKLASDEAVNLARALLSPQSIERAPAIAQEAGGSPFFINELAQYSQTIAANDLLSESELALKSISLEQVILGRVASLTDDARRILEIVAVAGQPLDQKVAMAAARIDNAEQSALAMLRKAQLVRFRSIQEQGAIEPYHDRIRETVVKNLAQEVLKVYHQRLARALKDSGRVDPETMALLLQEAGELADAADYAIQAAEQASAALAFDRAARLYRLALELRDRRALELRADEDLATRSLRVKLADALMNAGRGTEAARIYLAAVAGADAAETLELQRRAAEQFLRSGRIDEGLAVIAAVLEKMGMKLAASPRRALLSLLFRRARIKLRGLNYQERNANDIPAEKLLRIDACWSIAVGLSLVDNIRGADFQALHLLLALDAGEPYRVSRALAMEASYCATGGGRARRQSELFGQTAIAIAKRIKDPHAEGVAITAAGTIAFLEGRWQKSRALSAAAERILSERCTGVAWELDMAQYFLLRCLFWLGELDELSQRAPELLLAGQERGDLYAVANLVTRVLWVVRLAADEPDRAEQEISQALAQWSRQGFHSQHYFGLVGQLEISLYCGKCQIAWQLMEERSPAVMHSLLLRIQELRIEWLYLRARCALAMAAAVQQPLPYWRAAARDAAKIEREKMSWADPLARLIRAAIAASNGRSDEAITLLAISEAGFEAADMTLHAAVARSRRGELLGDEEGKALIDEVNGWMINRMIQRPGRLTAMLAPGIWSRQH